jgi:hypothetical protein
MFSARCYFRLRFSERDSAFPGEIPRIRFGTFSGLFVSVGTFVFPRGFRRDFCVSATLTNPRKYAYRGFRRDFCVSEGFFSGTFVFPKGFRGHLFGTSSGLFRAVSGLFRGVSFRRDLNQDLFSLAPRLDDFTTLLWQRASQATC